MYTYACTIGGADYLFESSYNENRLNLVNSTENLRTWLRTSDFATAAYFHLKGIILRRKARWWSPAVTNYYSWTKAASLNALTSAAPGDRL
jgi:hypothetical protein